MPGWCLTVLLGIAAGGCQGPAARDPAAALEARPARTPGAPVERCLDLVAGASEVRILVYRDGPLARLGHNHVLVARGLEGVLAITNPVSESLASIRLDVSSIEVDPVPARVEEGAEFAERGVRGSARGHACEPSW